MTRRTATGGWSRRDVIAMGMAAGLAGGTAPLLRAAAAREGGWKYLKIGRNEQLFNLVEDERERAERAEADPERFKAMRERWLAWNATMLPYPKDSFSFANTAMDRY